MNGRRGGWRTSDEHAHGRTGEAVGGRRTDEKRTSGGWKVVGEWLRWRLIPSISGLRNG